MIFRYEDTPRCAPSYKDMPQFAAIDMLADAVFAGAMLLPLLL